MGAVTTTFAVEQPPSRSFLVSFLNLILTPVFARESFGIAALYSRLSVILTMLNPV